MCKVSMNKEKNGIELAFSSKPQAEVIASIKAQGFRWHNQRKIWYAKQTDERIIFAHSLEDVKQNAKKAGPKQNAKKAEAPKEAPKAEVKSEVKAEVKTSRPHTDAQMLALFNNGKLEEVKKALEENIRFTEQTGKGTKTSDLQIVKRITKGNGTNPAFEKAHEFTVGNKKFYGFTNGFYVIASANDFGIEHTEKPLIFAKFFSKTQNARKIKVDLADLRSFLKIHTSKKDVTPYVLEVEGKKIGFNARYMLDVLTFCDTDEFVIDNEQLKASKVCYKAQLTIGTEGRIGLVLPINITK